MLKVIKNVSEDSSDEVGAKYKQIERKTSVRRSFKQVLRELTVITDRRTERRT